MLKPQQMEVAWRCCDQTLLVYENNVEMEMPFLVRLGTHRPTKFRKKLNQPHYLNRFLTGAAITPLLHEGFLNVDKNKLNMIWAD